MWNRSDPSPAESHTDTRSESTPSAAQAIAPTSGERARSSERQAAVIGPSISIRGDLTGEEDLVIEGRVEGEVQLKQHRVEVGQGGRVKADIHAKTIHVLGQVDGNLAGDEEVVIRASGRVVGNIAAPRVTLEDGCNFRGTVDMSPRGKGQEKPSGQRQPEPERGRGGKKEARQERGQERQDRGKNRMRDAPRAAAVNASI